MWNLAKTCAIVAICLGATGAGWAQSGPRVPPPNAGPMGPVLLLGVRDAPLRLGVVSGPSAKQFRKEVVAHVVANRPYRVVASFEGLTETAGRRMPIPATQMVVKINGREVPVGTDLVQVAVGGPTPPCGLDIPVVVEMQVKGVLAYPAGRYSGNLALRIMPR